MGEPARLELAELGPRRRPPPPPRAPKRDRIAELELSPPAESLLRALRDIRDRRRKVVPSLATLAARMGRSERTVQRYLAELHDRGVLVRLYNGGRGRRCIYYVGFGAAAHAAAHAPEWCHDRSGQGTASRRRRERAFCLLEPFGKLRQGRLAAGRSSSGYPDKSVTLNDDHSLLDLRGSERDHRDGNADAGEQAASALTPAPVTSAPPAPLSGGGGTASPATAAHEPSGNPPTAPDGPRTDAPPGPQGGEQKRGQKGTERGQPEPRPRAWSTHPQLWRAAWGMWRVRYQIRFGDHPLPNDHDALAMHALVTAALFASAQNQGEALRYLAWWFGKYLQDRRPFGAHPDEVHALWRLARSATRNNYGRPPATWAPKTQAELEATLAARAARKPEPTGGGAGAGPAPAPAKNLTRGEQALADLEASRHGPIPPRPRQ